MIEVKNIKKKFGSKTVLADLSFSVQKGMILGFLGPNGAGKSVTMNIITGYLASNSGSVTIDGVDVMQDPLAIKKKIGYLPEKAPLYLDMTVKEYLNFVFDLKKIPLNKKEHLTEICKLVLIDDVYDRVIGNLSNGYKRRVGIAQALLGFPPVIILDEPTVGLDPNQIIEIRNLIKKLGKKHTVIFSSHILSEIQAICDQIIIINHGEIIANDTSENLILQHNKNEIFVDALGNRKQIAQILKEIDGVLRVVNLKNNSEEFSSFRLIFEGNSIEIRKNISKALAQSDFSLVSLSSLELSLEDIFIKLINDSNLKLQNIAKNSQNGGIQDATDL